MRIIVVALCQYYNISFEESDPVAADQAQDYYSCLGQKGKEQLNPLDIFLKLDERCYVHILEVLQEQHRKYEAALGPEKEESFNIFQNVLFVKDAAGYYHSMILGGVSSWSLRDTHMARW